jgi:hypothetical protein
MSIVEGKWTIRLFNPGNDTAVAIYNGCKEYSAQGDGNVVVFVRASGQHVETNLRFEAIQE